MKKIISTILATVAFMPLLAQSMNGDYKNVGVYDTWEQSPFRTGVLTGNVQVIENHLYDANGVNRTGHILGIQRSRFGSNTFGARVDLNSPVTIGRDGKYVHALVYSPIATQVQFIGLGKRTTNTWNEKEDVEQFWSDPVSISANRWTDIVSLVKTNENVEIYSIVVVPDCSSPHALTEDFVAYIDEIVINDSEPRRSVVTSAADPYDGTEPGGDVPVDPDESLYYKTSFNKKTTENMKLVDSSSSKNYAVSVSLTDADGYQQQYPSDSAAGDLLSKKVYLDATGIAVFDVTAGQKYTPYVDYKSDWMHAYAYIDYDRNGEFTYQLDGNKVAEGSELVAFSAYSPDYTGGATGTWYDSKGNRLRDINAGNTITMPSFTIPSDLQSGRYRMRFKVDWNSLDAAGNNATDNAIWNNGGAIVDVILKVTGSNDVSVKLANSRNGNIQDSNGNAITSGGVTGTYNSPFQVVMKPASGFASNSLTAAYMTDDSDYPGLLKEATATYPVSGDNYDSTSDAFTLPAEMMYSSVTLEPLFTEAPTPAKTVIYQLTDKLEADGEYLIVNVNSEGDGFALSHNMDKIASDDVTIHGKDENPSVPAENVYIPADVVDAGSVWTATKSGNYMKLENGNYKLQLQYSVSKYILSAQENEYNANGSWSYNTESKRLSYTYTSKSSTYTYYVVYDNAFVGANKNNTGKVYLYKKVEVEAPSAKTFDLTIGDAGWATLYLDFAVDIPEGLTEVFYISSIEDGVAKGKTVADAIPAETGVLIKGGKGTYHLTESSTAAKPTDNLLTGTLVDIADASIDALTSSAYGKSLYTLGRTNSGKVQLALFTGKKIEKNKAFLIWEGNGTVGEAKAFSIVMDNGTTAITAVNDGETGSDDWYSLQGVRLSGRPTQKGVYIHQGKRIFVK
ncbi:MAG: hypothetical protein J6I34_03565 [Prevotella sp.]|nr:hypothetical protein [Prevotella sp.]